MERVLIANPDLGPAQGPARCPPIRAGYLASYIRSQLPSLDVQIFDFKVSSLIEFQRRLSEHAPELILLRIGLNINEFAASALPYSEKLIRQIRIHAPEAIIVAVGPYVTVAGEEIFNNETIASGCDYIIMGEEEKPAASLIKRIMDGENVNDVEGIYYRADGEWQGRGIYPFDTEPDELPLPAYDLMELGKYKWLSVLTSRGCAHQCTFCYLGSVAGKKFRPRSPENVLSELEYLVKHYGNDTILAFIDEDFFHDRARVVAICQGMIDRQLGLRWIVLLGARIDEVDEELLRLAKRAGCCGINFGVESGSQSILDRMRKGITVEQIGQVTKWLYETQIDHCFFLQVGHPSETKATARETFKLMKRLRPSSILVNMVIPYPKTGVGAWAKRYARMLRTDCSDSYYTNVGLSIPEPVFDTVEFRRRDRIAAFRKLQVLGLALQAPSLLQLARLSKRYVKDNRPIFWIDVVRILAHYVTRRIFYRQQPTLQNPYAALEKKRLLHRGPTKA